MSVLVDLLPAEEQDAAAATLSGCPSVALPAGTVRTASRLPEAALLVVEEGIVLVTSLRAGASRRMIVAVAGPGSILPPPAADERLEPLVDSWLTSVCPGSYQQLLALPGAARTIVEALAQELVGEMVGSARETVTWAFQELAREGFVQRVGRTYRLAVRPEALAS